MVCLCTEIEQSARDMIAMTDPTATEDTSVVNHMKSQYQRRKAQSTTQKHQPRPRQCKWCGKDGGNCFPRKDKCAAWSNVCENCMKRGHFSKICNSPPSVPTQVDSVEIGSVQVVGSLQWDNHAQAFVSANNEDQKPRTIVQMRPFVHDQDKRPATKWPETSKSYRSDVMADSGAQICAAGIGLLKSMGCTKANLLYSKATKITAANGTNI